MPENTQTHTRVHAMKDDALGSGDALSVAARIQSREISASEAVEAAIERWHSVKERLSTTVVDRFDTARQEAAGFRSGVFAGVPTAIKDNVNIIGLPTRSGSRATSGRVATSDSAIVRRVLATGAIPIVKTKLPEFGLIPTTEYEEGEPARNPWNTSYSTGGSSGGSAALVAAGVLPFAHANDGGGSIRIPASCCGLVGFKPS